MTVNIERQVDPRGVEAVLRSLPEWFGIEDSLQEYVEQASVLDSVLASRRSCS